MSSRATFFRMVIRRGNLPYLVLLALAIVLALLPTTAGVELTSANLYDIFQNFANAALLALALGITMIAGEFDLSVAATFGLGGVVAVETGAHNPWLGVAVAVAAGLMAGALQGSVVTFFGINAMAVTLGGFLAIAGIAELISRSRTLSYSNYEVGAFLQNPIAGVLSWQSVIVLMLFVVAVFVHHRTRLGVTLRGVGGDRRAARTAGLPIGRTIVIVFVVAGALSAFSGALASYGLASAAPVQNLEPLVFAATAAILGGVTLTGGVGSPLGIAAAGLALSIMQEIFTVLAAPSYFSNLATAALLMAVAIIDAPDLVAWWKGNAAVRRVLERNSTMAGAVAGKPTQ